MNEPVPKQCLAVRTHLSVRRVPEQPFVPKYARFTWMSGAATGSPLMMAERPSSSPGPSLPLVSALHERTPNTTALTDTRALRRHFMNAEPATRSECATFVVAGLMRELAAQQRRENRRDRRVVEVA